MITTIGEDYWWPRRRRACPAAGVILHHAASQETLLAANFQGTGSAWRSVGVSGAIIRRCLLYRASDCPAQRGQRQRLHDDAGDLLVITFAYCSHNLVVRPRASIRRSARAPAKEAS